MNTGKTTRVNGGVAMIGARSTVAGLGGGGGLEGEEWLKSKKKKPSRLFLESDHDRLGCSKLSRVGRV